MLCIFLAGVPKRFLAIKNPQALAWGVTQMVLYGLRTGFVPLKVLYQNTLGRAKAFWGSG